MIKIICKSITEGHNLTDDLISEVSITVFTMDNALLNDIMDRGKLNSYIYGIANTMFWKPKSKFYYQYKTDTCELIEDILTTEDVQTFDVKEYLIDLGLEPTEKLWVETCLEYNFNYSLVAKKVGVSRSHVSKRIKAIKNKYKK
jgi:hypothetical protein